MQTGYRFRCYPTREQEAILLQWIGHQRFIYNAKVREDRYFRAFKRRFVEYANHKTPIDQKYAQFIGPETAWLREVPSHILRNGAVRWRQAYSRYFAGLAARPTIRKNVGVQSAWLTRELFRFEPMTDPDTGEAEGHRLVIGTKKFPVGELRYKAHRAHTVPVSITLSIDAGHWYLSFNTDDGQDEANDQAIGDWLASFTDQELAERTVGIDRGVVIPACASNGQDFGLTRVQQARLAKKARGKARWQRRMARRVKGSGGWRKAKRRAAAHGRYAKHVRWDFAHQTSHALVSNPRTALLVFEALQVRNMTRKPRPKQDEAGRYRPNRATAKAGLNRRILESAWGQVRSYSQYKARRAGKLVLDVPAQYSSQACAQAQCGYTHPDNRLDQARFVCQRCGHTDNADRNAAKVLAARGMAMIRSGGYRPKVRKKTMRLRNTVGPERSEPGPLAPTPVETSISRDGGNIAAHGSPKPETPATAQRA